MVGDLDIPIMYQDLANYTMSPMNIPLGGITGNAGMYGGNTSYLGGVQMKPQLDNDKVQLMNKKDNEAKNTALKIGAGLAAVFLMGFIPSLFGKKSLFSQLGSKISATYAKYKPQISNLGNKIKGQNGKIDTIKTWCSDRWTAFKGLFKGKKQTP